MPEDELEHLRAILARAYDEPPKKKGVGTIMRRLAGDIFATPKKVIIERVKQQYPRKKDAA